MEYQIVLICATRLSACGVPDCLYLEYQNCLHVEYQNLDSGTRFSASGVPDSLYVEYQIVCMFGVFVWDIRLSVCGYQIVVCDNVGHKIVCMWGTRLSVCGVPDRLLWCSRSSVVGYQIV